MIADCLDKLNRVFRNLIEMKEEETEEETEVGKKKITMMMTMIS